MKCYLVYCDLGYDGISLIGSKVFTDRTNAEVYRIKLMDAPNNWNNISQKYLYDYEIQELELE